MTTEPRWLTETTLLAIHAQQVERFGGAHGVRDQHVVLSALARAQQRWNYDQAADLADCAAVYLVGFAQSQGFTDGNMRTGLACALVFLAVNGAALHVDGSELYALTMRVAINQADDGEVAAYVRERLSSSLRWCGGLRARPTHFAAALPASPALSATSGTPH